MADLKTKKNISEFFKYSSLNILGMIGLSCYILADTFFVSKAMGTRGLAALNIALPIFNFIFGCGLMFGMGGSIKFSVVRENNAAAANKYFTDSVKMGAVMSVLFVVLGLTYSDGLAALLGADGDTMPLTSEYLHTVLMFAPMFIANNMMQCFVRNDKNPKLAMLAMLIGSLTNVVLDYVFMFPLGMGMFGAALATGVAPVIGLCIQSVHIFKRKNSFVLVRSGIKPRRLVEIAALGIPSLVTELSSGIVIAVFNMLILKLSGNTGVAAYGVIANISLVVISVFTGVAQGSQPLVSAAFGAKRDNEVHLYSRLAIITAVALASVIYGAVAMLAAPITSVFNSEQNAELEKIAITGMRIYFSGIIFAGFNIVKAALFAATERAVPAHVISLMRGLVLVIPSAYLLAAMLGMTGVWLAFPITEFITAATAVLLSLRLTKNKTELK